MLCDLSPYSITDISIRSAVDHLSFTSISPKLFHSPGTQTVNHGSCPPLYKMAKTMAVYHTP